MLAHRVRLVAVAVAPTVAALALLAAAPAASAGTQPSSDLSVSVETTPGTVGLGDRVEFVVTVLNQGPDAGGGVLKARWSAGLAYVSEQRTGIRRCRLARSPSLRASCPFDALDPSGTATMTLVMSAADVGKQKLDVSLRGENEDPNPADDHDSATVNVLGPLAGPTVSPAVVRPALSPSPTPAPTHSPTPSPIPSGGIQTGDGGTAGGRSPLPPVAASLGVLAAGALWLARRRRLAPRARAGKLLH